MDSADGRARTKLRWGSVLNPVGLDLIEQVQQMQIEIDAIKKVTHGSSAPDAGHSEMQRRRAQANGGGAGAGDADSAAVVVKQFSIDVRPVQVVIDPAGGENGHRRAVLRALWEDCERDLRDRPAHAAAARVRAHGCARRVASPLPPPPLG